MSRREADSMGLSHGPGEDVDKAGGVYGDQGEGQEGAGGEEGGPFLEGHEGIHSDRVFREHFLANRVGYDAAPEGATVHAPENGLGRAECADNEQKSETIARHQHLRSS